MENRKFEGKVAVVTGAGGTLCSVIAKNLAKDGAKVVLIGRTEEKLAKVADAIRQDGGDCLVFPADVTDEARIEEAAQKVLETYGGADFLINGAGGNNPKAITTDFTFDKTHLDNPQEGETNFYDLDMDTFRSVLEINTVGTVIPTRAFSRQMIRKGGGNIINFASMNSYRPLTRVPAYAMSKAAVINLTEWLAVYFAESGIRVNAVAPGFFVNERSVKILRTPDGGLTQRGQNVMNHTPVRRFGEPEELYGCVSWLLDDASAGFVTGITVPVDGGFLAHSGI